MPSAASADLEHAPTTTAAPVPWAGRRVVLVHDWLTGMRGGEKVLECLCRLFPAAEILTLVHVPGSVSSTIESHRIRTSFVQRLPRPGRYYRHYLPIFPTAIECFDLDDVDLVVSTSHCAAKSVVPNGRPAGKMAGSRSSTRCASSAPGFTMRVTTPARRGWVRCV